MRSEEREPAYCTSAGTLTDSIEIAECGAMESEAWDDFVMRFQGTYCHLYGWKNVLERSYRLKTWYLVFRSRGEWAGILPLALMPHLPGLPAKAISLPYCNYGSLLTAPGAELAVLRAKAVEYMRAHGICSIEFRERAEYSRTSDEVSMLLTLPGTAQQLWAGLGAKVRNQVRKAQRSNLTVAWGTNQTGSLYDIYATRMGELGTPVHSRRFIDEILVNFGDRVDILTVYHDRTPAAAMLLVRFHDTWIDPLAASLSKYKAMNPNMLLYWEALKAACEAGVKEFDFGRSHRGSSTYNFKKQWGSQEIGLNYYTYRNSVPTPAAATDFYRSDSASLLSRTWRNLPTRVQRCLGPVVRRWVP